MSGCCMDGTCGAHDRTLADVMDTVTVLEGEHSTVATNGSFGGWVKTKRGSYVSMEYAKSLNRAQRRAEGIKL